MPQALAILLILTPLLTLLPVLPLARPLPDAPVLPGVRAVTIKTVTPRRGFILLVLSALALSYALEAAALVLDLVGTPFRHEPHQHTTWFLTSTAAHGLGGVVVFALAGIFAEWRTRWGDWNLVVLALLAFGLEVPILVLTILREVHSDGPERVFNILLIVFTSVRLFLLPILIWLVCSPIVRFQAADERTGLLADTEESAPSSLLEATGNGYGTFEGDTSRDASRTGTPHPPVTGPDGTNSPSGIQKVTRIPKKLGQKKEDPVSQGISWKAFWARIWKLRAHLWPATNFKLQLCCYACIAILGISQVVNIFVPLMLGKFVDALAANTGGRIGPSPWPWFTIWISLYAIQGAGFLSFLSNMLWVPVQQYADREMQLLLFRHLLDLSLAFHTKRNTGEVLKILDRGSALNNLLQVLLFSAIPTLLSIVITPIVLFGLFSSSVSFVLALVMVSYLTFSIVFTSYRTKLRRLMVERDIKTRGIASDTLMNWESVKYFCGEHLETRRFGGAIAAYQETEYKVLISFNLLNLIQRFIITLGLLSCSLLIANSILVGTASVGSFVMFLQYLQQLITPLDRFGTLYRQLNANSTDAEKLFNLLQQPTEIRDIPGAKDLVVTDGVIEFDNVWFSYGGDVQALKGVSFRIGKGESMALVGESGSGKSTILRLLYRFYDIDSGTIYIDGQDISKVTQRSLRQAIGIVPQDSVLWNDTIAANIGYGKEGASDDEIIAAAKAAKLHDRIMSFPEEYATVVGERGVRLSGGEKQRVSLARMFLKSPAILVLDEATSALDTETEREIQKSLAELAQNRSSLSIAHRLSTIIDSDLIVVMKDGKVIEHGTYHELLQTGGQFSTMWKKQIFTEAEYLADSQRPAIAAAAAITEGESPKQAEEAATAAAAELAPDSDLEEVHIHRASPPSTVAEGDDEMSISDDKSRDGDSGGPGDGDAKAEATPISQSPSSQTPVVQSTELPTNPAAAPEPTQPKTETETPAAPSKPEPTAGITKSEAADAVTVPAIPTVSKPNPDLSRSQSTPFPGTSTRIAFPSSNPVSPAMSRTPSAASSRIRIGSSFHDSPAMTRTPSSSSSRPRQSSEEPPVADHEPEGKTRKRLSSIKGFVKRMSEERTPLLRRDSTKSNKSVKSNKSSLSGSTPR